MDQETFQKYITDVTETIRQTLFLKNKSYGGSAVIEDGIFSKASVEDRLAVRIDDKVQRIKNLGFEGFGEDNLNDLIGYLVILKAYREYRKDTGESSETGNESTSFRANPFGKERKAKKSSDKRSLAALPSAAQVEPWEPS